VNDELVERVNRTGVIFIGPTKLHGRTVLRLAVGNARTSDVDVRRAWDVLRGEAETVGR
jgi:aromatic-L-amino-acid decarboxylase